MGRLRRPTPLSLRLLAAMFIPLALSLVGAYFAINRIQVAHARDQDVANDVAAAKAVAKAESSRRGPLDYRAFQELIGGDQLTVTDHGRLVFAGPPNRGKPRFTIKRSFPGGQVVIVGDVDPTPGLTLELTSVAAVVLVVAIIVVVIGTRTLMRAVREPISRAVQVADRLAGGDLTARMGTASGPDEFRRLARAFDEMASRLQFADKYQERFLADLAHEIATPVNGIIGLSGAVFDGTLETPLQLEEAEDLLHDQTEWLRSLLNDLRRLRFLSLPGSVSWQPVEVGNLVGAVVRRFSREAEEAGLRLVTRSRAVEVVSDPRLIEVVLTNLVTNAIRYTPPDGTVEIDVRAEGRRVVVAVRDTGIGIGPDERDRIFDRFYRVDSSRVRDSGGSGLGLSIARRSANALGGSIELSSSPGSGSEFRLILPLAPPDQADPRSEDGQAAR